MATKRSTLRSLLVLLLVSTCLLTVSSCLRAIQDHQFPNPMTLAAVQGPPVANDLMAPIGLAEDPKGNLWVTEAGSGTVNNGQVSVITPAGKFPAIIGFTSGMSPEDSPEGLNHLIYKDGKLYILHGLEDVLYIVDISTFVPGVTPAIQASTLTKIDIGTYVRGEHPNAPDAPDSNPYNLVFGPDGDLFITDAGANAIVRRNKDTGDLSIYATFPDVSGPFSGDVVPTGIVYDGTKFLVTSLTGAPFLPGIATIYQVTPNGTTGTVSIYKSGFSGLTDIELTPGGKPIATEFGFSTPGRVVNGDDENATLLSGAITPVDILRSNMPDTYYILYYGPGIIVKLNATN